MFKWFKNLLNRGYSEKVFEYDDSAKYLKRIVDDSDIAKVCKYIENTQNIHLTKKAKVHVANYLDFTDYIPANYKGITKDQEKYLKRIKKIADTTYKIPDIIVFYVNGIKHIIISMDIILLAHKYKIEKIKELMIIEAIKCYQLEVRGYKYFSRHAWLIEGQARILCNKAFGTEVHHCSDNSIIKKNLNTDLDLLETSDKYNYKEVFEQCVFYVLSLEDYDVIDYKPRFNKE